MARRHLDVSVVFRVTRPDYKLLKRWARERQVDMADILRGLLEQERERVASATASSTSTSNVAKQAA